MYLVYCEEQRDGESKYMCIMTPGELLMLCIHITVNGVDAIMMMLT